MSETRKPFTDNVEEALKKVVELFSGAEVTGLTAVLDQTHTEYVEPTQAYLDLTAWIKWFRRNRVETVTTVRTSFQEKPDSRLLLEEIKKLFADTTGGWEETSANTVVLRELLLLTGEYVLAHPPGPNEIDSIRRLFPLFADEQLIKTAILPIPVPPPLPEPYQLRMQCFKRPKREKPVVGVLKIAPEQYAAVRALIQRRKDSGKVRENKVSTLPEKERPPRRRLDPTIFAPLQALNGVYDKLAKIAAAKKDEQPVCEEGMIDMNQPTGGK